jgi:hypothetical protein
MDAARTQAIALWVASEMVELRGPDPEVPRFVLDVPSDVGPGDAGRSAEAGDGPG